MSRNHAPFRIAACLCLMLLSAGQAWGWGKDGHRIIGRLAEAELSPVAQTEVARLLAGEPEPTLEGASTWADQIRDLPEGRGTARWHWLDLPKENPCRFVEERDCKDGNCVVGAIRAQFTLLADHSKPDTERRDALKFLVHFVGDVHQPFHAGFGFDRGGNNTQVRWLERGTNLHALWDTAMVQQAGLEPDAYAAQLQGGPALPPDRTIALSRPEVEWALESCRIITESDLYPQRRVIPRSYMEQHRPLAETRLRQAGQRLGHLINVALAASAQSRNPR